MSVYRIATALCAVLLLTGCAPKQPAETVIAQPPFWAAEHPGSGAVVYMLGSMHVGEDGIVYPEYVTSAFDSCDTVAVEVDVDGCTYEEIVSASRQLLMPDDTSAQECFGEDYGEVVDFLREMGVYERAMEEFIPYYWCSSLTLMMAEESGLSSDYGTESIFLARARAQDKQIAEIESIAEQYAMMADIPMDVQVQSVLDTVGDENYEAQVAATRQMYEDWLCFDEEELEQLNDDGSGELPEGYDEFMRLMYLDRQMLMADYIADCLENGRDVFVIVGAAHFYIEEDILTLLEQQGYIIRPIRG